ncbi:hypothetical protein NLG97_g1824 [Lecanicillium saksenae]|uniref:Uncharacterized protein n=1 Tax=Lecanicillium saksenae TaxID=468837 RepID=A0ACC1R3X5_9HYPO|nr:hypothetical protein NLG97_g1824 [Lecanicillium saksenae]
MFYTFNTVMTDVVTAGRPTRVQSRAERRQNSQSSTPKSQSFRACVRCRQHRIKCSEKPCEPCRINNRKCVWTEEPSVAARTPITQSSLATPRPAKPSAPSSARQQTATAPYASPNHTDTEEGVGESLPMKDRCPCAQHPNTPNSSHSHSDDTSQKGASSHASPASNIMNNFQNFLQSLGMVPSAEEGSMNLFPSLPSAGHGRFFPTPMPATPSATEALNWDSQLYFVRICWMSLAPLFPIMPEADFEALYTADGPDLMRRGTIEGALINGMTALGIQCAEATGSGGRILGCSPTAGSRSSFEYFRRCRDVVQDQEGGKPACVSTIRCYILLALYELQANQLEKAYYMIGLGVRRAYIGRFHLPPATHYPTRIADDRIRVWWLLYWLDVHCSLELGRPTAVQRSSNACPSPSPPNRFTPMQADVVSNKEASLENYRFVLSKLTTVVAGALDDMPWLQSLEETNNATRMENSASRLCETIAKLEASIQELPDKLLTPHGSRTPPSNAGVTVFSPSHQVASSTTAALTIGVPDWLQRQRLVLELHYLDACLVLQRPFVLWRHGRATDAAVSQHANSAVHRACSVLSLLRSVYSRSDILDRLTMVLPFIWNAITTIAAHAFVEPQGEKTEGLLGAVTNALAILEPLSRTSPDSLQVYQISQSLAGKLRDPNGTSMAMPLATSSTLTNDFFNTPFTGSLDLDDFLSDEVPMTDNFSEFYPF